MSHNPYAAPTRPATPAARKGRRVPTWVWILLAVTAPLWLPFLIAFSWAIAPAAIAVLVFWTVVKKRPKHTRHRVTIRQAQGRRR